MDAGLKIYNDQKAAIENGVNQDFINLYSDLAYLIFRESKSLTVASSNVSNSKISFVIDCKGDTIPFSFTKELFDLPADKYRLEFNQKENIYLVEIWREA